MPDVAVMCVELVFGRVVIFSGSVAHRAARHQLNCQAVHPAVDGREGRLLQSSGCACICQLHRAAIRQGLALVSPSGKV
jgi:hypothetical protein